MDPISSLALSAGLVVAGTWAKGAKLSIREFVGFAVLLVMLTVLDNINTGLARGFGVLILLTALLVYGLPVMKKLGLSS